MYDFKTELVAKLKNILPTYYEYFVDSSIETPCITYMELSNTANAEGDDLRYSNITYRIKIWGKDVAELSKYSSQLDKLMFSLGFKRVSYNELWVEDMGQLIFSYQALAKEKLQ